MPRTFEGVEGQFYSQAEVDTAAAAARREGKAAGATAAADDYDGLTPKQVRELKEAHDKAQADLTTANQAKTQAEAEKAKLEGDIKARDAAEVTRKALKEAGFRDDRIDRLMKDVPDGTDFADDKKAKEVIDKLKTDYPEWVGSSQQGNPPRQQTQTSSNGVKGSPTNGGDTKPQAGGLKAALSEFVAPKA